MTQKPRRTLVYRHSRITRVTHWINLLALTVLLMSGLQIFNAHPALYWGQKATFARPWLAITTEEQNGAVAGVTQIGAVKLKTTGVLGYSGKPGAESARGFPAWATAPSYQSLADGRRWHFFFAWLFVLNGLTYLTFNLANGHVRRDLLPTGDQLSPRHLWHEILDHARLRFPKGEAARRYNALQKGAYLGVIFGLLPLMVMTGLTMSPSINAGAPWLLDLFGGRQSARTIHFISASLIVAFVLVHVAMVVFSGLINNLRSMVTGRYAIQLEGEAK
jgi:thiosulfate reductase cytochrome b subunit